MSKLFNSKYSSTGRKLFQLQQMSKEKELGANKRKRLGFQDINEYFLKCEA